MDTPSAARPSGADRPPIFILDDEPEDRESLGRALALAGIDPPCRQFACGEEMLDALIDVLRGAPPPRVCFVDVKMAGMSGLDVLRWIRAQDGLHSVPVVMFSDSEMPAWLHESLHFGAQCYVAKFPRPEELRAIVAAAERFSSAATSGSSFPLPCNLLLEQAGAS